jgi:hypothetical protein
MSDDTVDYRLADGEAMNRANPRSFFIPSRAEREALKAGDVVKLLFELVEPQGDQPSAERMWVHVVDRDSDGYLGELTNAPAVITTIGLGDTLRFGPEHVITTTERWPLLEKKVFVSRRSQTEDVRPGYVYREEPDNEIDSGWRALIGDETDEEVDDADNLLLQSVGFLLDRWPELRPVFKTDPDNAEWFWDDEEEDYVQDD